jgi:alkylated DNA repair dioxygenase AlkB
MHVHLKNVFQQDYSSALINRLPWKHVQWRQGRTLPRLVCSMDVSNLLHFIPELVEVVIHIQEKYGSIMSVWMNYYRDGRDYTPYHKDSYNCTVVSVSFGDTREFKVRNKSGIETSYMLSNGDIFVFDEEFNRENQHSIPKAGKNIGPRISLVFFCNRK